MSKEKLEIVQKVIEKALPVKATIISGHEITFSFSADKSTTLDFNQDYLRDISKDNIPDMIGNFDIINLIKNNNYKIINISEKGAIPYRGNRS
ncbi:hypothetical protein DESC_470002 [Desulfosarcina cetonica]|uniref:hypothetical protein n=1 Tax=Desulfosarcina cetonica TaxID=90730 RepID=UPI0006D282E5|nr:hypothetical protein [Desulfosarcina cetonica]VTR66287.1 hypothetical protein DESC_470002 [Desulfosarcina cetonica]